MNKIKPEPYGPKQPGNLCVNYYGISMLSDIRAVPKGHQQQEKQQGKKNTQKNQQDFAYDSKNMQHDCHLILLF